jgi:hypothetical protein
MVEELGCKDVRRTQIAQGRVQSQDLVRAMLNVQFLKTFGNDK